MSDRGNDDDYSHGGDDIGSDLDQDAEAEIINEEDEEMP